MLLESEDSTLAGIAIRLSFSVGASPLPNVVGENAGENQDFRGHREQYQK